MANAFHGVFQPWVMITTRSYCMRGKIRSVTLDAGIILEFDSRTGPTFFVQYVSYDRVAMHQVEHSALRKAHNKRQLYEDSEINLNLHFSSE
jgi:hypothetical protein